MRARMAVHRFGLVMENRAADGYVTEKILSAFVGAKIITHTAVLSTIMIPITLPALPTYNHL